MNVLATKRGSAHYPSMLEDVEARRPTEIELITGSLIREAERLGVPVPLHTTLYRLIKAKEDSYLGIQREAGMTARKRWGAFGALLAVSALAIAVAGTGLGGSTTNAASPIVIGWAFDSKGNMAPFDGPALAAAKVRIGQINGQGRHSRPAAEARDVRHEQQQPGEGEVVRGAAAREGRARHVHDLRRRLRDAGRPGVAEGGQADDRAVHRHRPDGPEALRQGGQARVQLRQRRPGRGLGDGRVRLPQGLADGEPRHEHAARLLQERRPGVREALHAARRQDRRP